MRRVLWIGVSLLMLPLVHSNSVNACVGLPPGSEPFYYNLEAYQVVATGEISVVSNSGANAILDIDMVLDGEALNDRIILARNSVADTITFARGRGVAGCKTMAPRLPQGSRFLAGLIRHSNGTYDGVIVIADDDGRFGFVDDSQEFVTRSYDDLIDFLSDVFDKTPTPPQHSINPRPDRVSIRTETRSYFLPVDQIDVISETLTPSICYGTLYIEPGTCNENIVAPNGIDTVSIYDIGTGADHAFTGMRQFVYARDGDSAVFSPDSALVSVWQEQSIHVYATENQFGLSKRFQELTLLNELTFDPEDPLASGAGAWSPNGRVFVFSSDSGVWYWDALTPYAQPVQILISSGAPILVRHFSPAGNFLALESNGATISCRHP